MWEISNEFLLQEIENLKVQMQQVRGGSIVGTVANATDANTVDDKHASELDYYTTAKARAYLSANQTITTDTWTKINLDTETYDVGNNFNTTLKKFVAPVPGYYLILGTILWQNTVISKNYYASIYINGNSIAEFLESSYSYYLKGVISDICHLNKNDYVELYGRHSSGVDKNVLGGTRFSYMSIHLLSKD